MDEVLRKATRTAVDAEGRARLLVEARRAGRITDERLRAAAWAGDEAAGLLMPDEHRAGRKADVSTSLRVLQELDLETHAVAILGLDAWVQSLPGGRRGAHVGHLETIAPSNHTCTHATPLLTPGGVETGRLAGCPSTRKTRRRAWPRSSPRS